MCNFFPFFLFLTFFFVYIYKIFSFPSLWSSFHFSSDTILVDLFLTHQPIPHVSFSLIFVRSIFLILHSLILSSPPSLFPLPLISFSYLSHLLNFYFFFSCLRHLSSSPTFLPFFSFSPSFFILFSPSLLPFPIPAGSPNRRKGSERSRTVSRSEATNTGEGINFC